MTKQELKLLIRINKKKTDQLRSAGHNLSEHDKLDELIIDRLLNKLSNETIKEKAISR